MVEVYPTKISVKLDHWPTRTCLLKFFFLFFALMAIFLAERNHLSNFASGSPKEHFCEIILQSGHTPTKRCHLKIFIFLAMAAILTSLAEPF